MKTYLHKITSENIRSFFLLILFVSIPFSIAGDDFAVIALYFVTIYRFIKKKEQWFSAPILYGMGLMLLGAIISSLFSGDVLKSLSYFKNFWRLGLPFLIYFAFRNRPYDPFLKILAVISSLVAVYAVIQFFTGLDVLRSKSLQEEYRAAQGVWYAVGIFSHHLTYGGVSLLLFSLFLPNVFSQGRSHRERLFFTLATACNLAATIVCMGRSIWLGTLTAVGVMILVSLGWKRSLMFVSLLGLVVGGAWWYSSTQKDSLLKTTAIGRRILSISQKANSDRLFMWEASLQVIKDNPILGLGPMRGKDMEPYYTRIAKKEKHLFQHPPTVGVHNIYLQNWIDFGLLGLLGYLIWWGTLLAQILSALRQGSVTLKENAQLLGCLAGLVGIMIAGFFENNFRDGEVQTTILLVMGLSLVLLSRHKTERTFQTT